MKLTVAFCLTLFVALTENAPLGDLYLPDDDVEILNIHNFKRLVENSTSAWLVEFYASWCGYCQRFAPSWKEFATEAAPWRNLVRVGVLECSDEVNTPICREFGIVKYPTVRYFHENYRSKSGNYGVVVPHGDVVTVENIKKSVIETLIEERIEGRGLMYPNLLTYYQSNLGALFNGVGDDVQYGFVIVEPSEGYLGAEVALDLYRTPNIIIRHSLDNNTGLMGELGIEKLPAVVSLERENNNSRIFIENVGTKSEIKEILRSFLADRSITLVETVPDKLINSTVDPNRDHNRTILLQYIKKMGDVVFQIDLESALRYSLRQEVATVETITGEKLQALNSYLKIIRKYFPFAYNSTSFIDSLVVLTSDSEEIKGTQIERLVKEAEQNGVFSSPQKFLGCQGSSSRYRGYPCSLWRLFHYLTVNSVLFNVNHRKANGREVLDAMHGYVKNFFSCSHCSEHFQKMAAERNLNGVASLEESVMWLWEAHNVVNNRLKGDETEDPESPKEQFPSKLRCSKCYEDDGSWNRNEVSRYLKRMYSAYNVRYIGADTKVLFPGLD